MDPAPGDAPPESTDSFAIRLQRNQRLVAWALQSESGHDMSGPSDASPDDADSGVMATDDASDAQLLEALGSDAPNRQIGPYRILRQIGAGGFGSVFEAEQLQPVSRRVALKLIKLGMDTREVIARFEAERQVLAMMDHPHIARVLDAGTSSTGRPYFVMELVLGQPISQYCDQNRLTIVERLTLFEQVCQAVQHAHGKGIIHRDLKPTNVLVCTQDGRPFAKVIDFGIAKAIAGGLTDCTALTQQQMIGTPHYMSPEQAESSPDIDTRSDIYALGVMLYELVTGSTPFESSALGSAGIAELQRLICRVDPPRPSARLSQDDVTPPDVATRRSVAPRKLSRMVRGEIDWIVMKAIEKERERRYETADALALDIRRYLAGQPVLAAPPSGSYRMRKFVRRNKAAVAAGVLVATSVLGGVVSFAWQARIAELRAAELAQVSTFQAEMLAQVDPTRAGELLRVDMTTMFEESLTKAAVSQEERAAAKAAFEQLWQRVNATDVAKNLIDQTIMKPAIAAIEQKFQHQPTVDAALRQVLADSYVSMGLFEEARPLQQAALATRRRVLGDEHPDTLMSIANMGEQFRNQGKFGEAEPYARDAVAKMRRVLGVDHPDTLTAINNLAALLSQKGDLSEAEPYYREALEKRRRVLGDEHPLTLNSVQNLGLLLLRQGRLAEAEPKLLDALDKRRRVLGEEHSDTLRSINVVGGLLREQGRLIEAEPYFREALDKRRRVLGEEHPYTLNSISALGGLLFSQGRLIEAESCFRDGLEKSRRVLGEDHPLTLGNIGNLGLVLLNESKLIEAEPFLLDALQRFRQTLGESHAETLGSLNNLGALRVAQGKFAEAAQLLAPAEGVTRKTFNGGNVFRSARLLTNLGKARAGMGEHLAAEADLLEAQGILDQTPGPYPHDRRQCTQALGDLYTAWHVVAPDQGYDAKAVAWQRKLGEIDGAPGRQ